MFLCERLTFAKHFTKKIIFSKLLCDFRVFMPYMPFYGIASKRAASFVKIHGIASRKRKLTTKTSIKP